MSVPGSDALFPHNDTDRRISPSVITFSPESCWSLMIVGMPSSWTRLSSSRVHRPATKSTRLATTSAGRKREPMWSARYRGLGGARTTIVYSSSAGRIRGASRFQLFTGDFSDQIAGIFKVPALEVSLESTAQTGRTRRRL